MEDAGKFELPQNYGDNKIVLMARDPWTLYAYWEIEKDVEDSVRGKIRQEHLTALKNILRVYEITDENEPQGVKIVSDFELKDWTNNWYIHTKNPGQKCMASIGIVCTTGEFFPLVQSNRVKTPIYKGSGAVSLEAFSSSCLLKGR